jgi:hypothetical protein
LLRKYFTGSQVFTGSHVCGTGTCFTGSHTFTGGAICTGSQAFTGLQAPGVPQIAPLAASVKSATVPTININDAKQFFALIANSFQNKIFQIIFKRTSRNTPNFHFANRRIFF